MENNTEGCSLRFHEFQANNEGFLFPDPASASAAMSWPLPPVQDHFLPSFPTLPPLPPPAHHHHHLYPFYGDMYARQSSTDPLGLAGFYMGSEALARAGGMSSSTSPFGVLHAELNKMTTQEIMDAKALAASKSHSEAERRRRERINAHLAKLRSLLPSTTKTDKASLLAEVIQHVKELKRQSSEIAEENPLPTESDELTVDATSDEDGRLLVRASLCCEDRSDLLPELIKALKALQLRALKAEITTLGGRVKNVLVITGEAGEHSVESIQDALKAVMERAAADEQTSASGTKRQRTTHLSTILEHSSL